MSWKLLMLLAVFFPLAALGAEPSARHSGAERLCMNYRGVPSGFGAAKGGSPNRAGMVLIKGGEFHMGSEDGYPEERNVHLVRLDSFLMDRHEVTNAQFTAFVKATGYITVAERKRDTKDYPGAPESQLVPGSVVFVWPKKGEQFQEAYRWWKYLPGANWRHPYGPESSITGFENHPVTQVAYDDALAYAKWLGRDLPTEAEFEYAARGGLDGNTYPWGNTPNPEGRWMANTWQGSFPSVNTAQDGYKGSAPVGCFPANGYGLFDAVGNVWEWTKDVYSDHHSKGRVENPLIVHVGQPFDTERYPARVIKGGSFLCAPDFCVRYRPSSRQPQDPTLGVVHAGFRTLIRLVPT